MRAIIIALGVLLLFHIGIIRAESSVGFSGMVGWTNQDHAPSPLGFGIFMTHFISERVQLMFMANIMTESISVYETIYVDYPPYKKAYGEPITDRYDHQITIHTYEFAILYRLIKLYPVGFDVGVGYNINFLNTQVYGVETRCDPGMLEKEIKGFGLLLNLSVKISGRLPLDLNLGFRQRLDYGSKNDKQDYSAFENPFKMSVIWAGISYIIE